MTHRLAVQILDLNRSADTEEAARRVLAHTKASLDVRILANGSREEHVQRLRAFANAEDDVTLHVSPRNLGFAGGHNYLTTLALSAEQTPTAVVLLNNDAFVEPSALDCLLEELLRRHQVGIVGPRVLAVEGDPDTILEDGMLCRPWIVQQRGRHVGEPLAAHPAREPLSVVYVNGTCLMIRWDLWLQLGQLDEQFFAYFEDWDLGLRARHAGYECVHVPRAAIRHRNSATTGLNSRLYHFLLTRNRMLLARKHLNVVPFALVFIPYFLLSRIVFKSLQLAATGRWRGLVGVWQGVAWLVLPKLRTRLWPIESAARPVAAS